MRCFLTAIFLLALPLPSHAQFVARPHLDWRTMETEHFVVHYPAQYREWTQAVVARLEGARTAVGTVIGFVPAERVQVLVDDPTNASNGFALPFVDEPTMVFFPVPPSPRQAIGNSRDWGELIAVHEFAHLAHLARPSRRPRDLFRLLPVHLGPIARGVPRWVSEGYATFVEGRVTGSGRPNNTQRAAVLRQWALEGRLPTYGQLSGSSAYQGGAFAYLGGSAYLDWLAAREGDSTITHLWRRMTARTRRSFPRAFAGVYGPGPEELYGRFTAEVTGRALAIEQRIDSLGGIVDGELVQRLAWETGDPALSPDGSRVAVVLRSATRPARVVVWTSGADTVAAHVAADRQAARERAQRLDTLDVPDRQFYPPTKRALATLEARDGRGFDTPRFMPDGRHVLVTRAEPIGDGAFRPDAYLWDTKDGGTRRITRGAAVRLPDPAPDGTSAVAVRCTRGWCDVVQVDLLSGRVAVLREGSPFVTYYRPRISPAGDRIAVAVQESDQWRIEISDAQGTAGSVRRVTPDRATRFDVSWHDDSTLLVASEASGITNLERIDVATGRAEPITRVTGAAYAPEVNRATGDTWFLSLHSRGLDVRRLAAGAPPVVLPAIDPREFPAIPVRPPAPAPALATRDSLVERAYGLGPRSTRILPGVMLDAGAAAGQLLFINGDPVGRLELALLGTTGSRSAWHGARTWATMRRWRPGVTVEAFHARQLPSERAPAGVTALDVTLAGAGLRTRGALERSAWRAGASLGLAAMRANGPGSDTDDSGRSVVWGMTDLGGTRRILGVGLAGVAGVRGDVGRHGDHRIGHVVVTGALRADAPLLPAVQATVVHARNASADGAPAFEQVAVGGGASPLLDAALLPQRHAMPALPAGSLVGREATLVRADVALGTFSPYGWAGRVAGSDVPGWKRVVGIEARFSTGAFPLVTLPRADLVGGAAHSFDAPQRNRAAVYVNVSYRP